MKEYVEREAALEKIETGLPRWGVFGNLRDLNDVRDVLNEAPAADVVERVRGEWVYHECVSSYDGARSGYSCSECNAFVDEENFDSDEFHKYFCGNCGADMSKEEV